MNGFQVSWLCKLLNKIQFNRLGLTKLGYDCGIYNSPYPTCLLCGKGIDRDSSLCRYWACTECSLPLIKEVYKLYIKRIKKQYGK